MKTYDATIRTLTTYAIVAVKARTPAAALTKARALWDANDGSLSFESIDPTSEEPDAIEIEEARGGGYERVALWQSADCALRLAAPDLLAALMLLVDTFAPDHERDFEGMGLTHFAIARAAIQKARAG